MTLDEAIVHCEEVARKNLDKGDVKCEKCAEQHLQLAKWLKELKGYKQEGKHDGTGHN